MLLWDKTKHIAQNIYGAEDIIADKKVRNQFKKLENDGFGSYPICMAKTQYSFSTDPLLMGAPTGHEVPIREVRLSAGAEFIVVVCGEIMTMPGLPRVPAAEAIGLDENNEIDVVIPIKTVSELIKSLGSDGDIIIKMSSSQIAFEFDNILIISSNIVE